jgi:aminopeptidase-like protein
MGVDIREDVKTVSNQVTTYQQYKEFKESYDGLKKIAGDNYEDNKKFISEVLNKVDRNKRKQDSTCTPFLQHLIKQLKKLDGTGEDTNKFVKKLYINALKDTRKGLVELLVKLAEEFLNCGENQQHDMEIQFGDRFTAWKFRSLVP